MDLNISATIFLYVCKTFNLRALSGLFTTDMYEGTTSNDIKSLFP